MASVGYNRTGGQPVTTPQPSPQPSPTPGNGAGSGANNTLVIIGGIAAIVIGGLLVLSPIPGDEAAAFAVGAAALAL